jgi:hypothetical protein
MGLSPDLLVVQYIIVLLIIIIIKVTTRPISDSLAMVVPRERVRPSITGRNGMNRTDRPGWLKSIR